MKNFSLVFLMCFSLGLQGLNPGQMNTISAAAQEALNAVEQKWSGSFPQLTALLDTMETNLCGITVSGASLDANGNYVNGSSGLQITVGGTSSNPTYAYTNCTGGAMNNVSLQAAQIKYWGDIIHNDDWESGYNACATNYQSGSQGDGTSFFADIPAINAYTTEIQTQINNIMGNGSSIASNYTKANNFVTELFAIANSLDSAIDASNMYTLLNAINPSAVAYNTAAQNLTACLDSHSGATCPTATPFCSNEFSSYLTAIQGYATAQEAFFDFMLKYVPNLGCSYSIKTQEAPMIACMLPSACKSGVDSNTCYYDAPFFTFSENVNTITQKLSSFINIMTNASNNYANQLQVAYVRLQAILSQSTNNLITGINNNQAALQSVLAKCQSDVADEQAAQLAGQIIGIVLVGAVTFVALPQLAEVGIECEYFSTAVVSSPPFGTDVFTSAANFIGSNITKGINEAGHSINMIPNAIVNSIISSPTR